MTNATFIVPGKARGKARPRVTKFATYTPDPGGWTDSVGYYAIQTVGRPNWEGCIELTFTVIRQMPSSWSKKKRDAMGGQPCNTIPDLVNIGAAICDALENILYPNDKQICSITCSKKWGPIDQTEIFVRCVDES